MRKYTLAPIGIFILFSILIFFNNNSAPVKFIAGFVQDIFSAPKSFLYKVKTGVISENEEIKKIKEENQIYVKKFIEFERIKKDNEALRSQFEAGTTKNYKLMPAHVIGFLGKSQSSSSLIVDRGEADGIKTEMAAIVAQNLIGKIGKVSQNYSEVALVNNKNFSTLAATADQNATGVISGQEDFILFDRVAVNENIASGQIVIAKGEINDKGFGVPADFIIGKIVSVSRNESLPFQTAKVEPSTDVLRLNMLFIIAAL